MVHLIIQLFLLSCIFLKQLNTCVKAKPVFLNTYSVLHMSFQTVYKLGHLGNYDPIFYRLGKFIDLVQLSLSCDQPLAAPWTAALQSSLSFTISQSLLRLMPIESVMPSNHFILCRPLLLLPSLFPSMGVFSNELALCIRWPKCWEL